MRKKIKTDMLVKLKSSQAQQSDGKQKKEETRDANSISLSSAQTPQAGKWKTIRDQEEFDEF